MSFCVLLLKASCYWLINTYVSNPLFISESQTPERPSRGERTITIFGAENFKRGFYRKCFKTSLLPLNIPIVMSNKYRKMWKWGCKKAIFPAYFMAIAFPFTPPLSFWNTLKFLHHLITLWSLKSVQFALQLNWNN